MKQYFNDPQQEVMYTAAKDTVVVGGRGIGKGPMQAAQLLKLMQRMPGCSIGIVGPNAKRVLTNTLPSLLIHWENWGFRRGVHWIVGRRPPESWGWGKPIFTPENWDNVLSFYNGSIAIIISQDRSGTSNSHSYDGLISDEAKFIDFEQLKDETLPANRGNKQHFGSHYFHHGMMITSDMPVTKKGSWFLDFERKCDPELIQVIQGIVYELWRLKAKVRDLQMMGKPVPDYLSGHMRTMERDLCRLRSVALFYKEYSSIYNLQLLGEKWVADMKRDLPPLTFQTSILCKRIGIARDGFYSSMKPSHKYHASNFGYLDSLEYKFDRLQTPSSLMDADVDAEEPICIAFDFNRNINWMVCGQPKDGRLRVLKSFYVKYERKLEALVDDFCQYYRHHKYKYVVFYFDNTALNGNYAVNDHDFRWVIVDALETHGWTVEEVYIGRAMAHYEKHLLINRMLAGHETLVPVFNETNNEDLLISIQTAGVYNGKKDKRAEKLAETEEDKLEGRTDGSDAFDTLCIGCERYPRYSVTLFVTSSMG